MIKNHHFLLFKAQNPIFQNVIVKETYFYAVLGFIWTIITIKHYEKGIKGFFKQFF
jgi:hypothetical protein